MKRLFKQSFILRHPRHLHLHHPRHLLPLSPAAALDPVVVVAVAVVVAAAAEATAPFSSHHSWHKVEERWS